MEEGVGGKYVPSLNFSPVKKGTLSLSVFHYCFCAYIRRRHIFNLSLCRLSPFYQSYVTVSRPSRWLSEFHHTSGLSSHHVKVQLVSLHGVSFARNVAEKYNHNRNNRKKIYSSQISLYQIVNVGLAPKPNRIKQVQN